MYSPSKSSINFALRLAAVLAMTSSAIEAQGSTAPKRHRSNSRKLGKENFPNIQELEYDMSVPLGHLRKLEEDISMPLEELEMSVPLKPGLRTMSLKLEQSEFDMSVPLQQSEMSVPLEELELSVPLEELELSVPADAPPASSAEGSVPLETGGESGGSAVVLASFAAGVSALIVGAAALFVRMRRRKDGDDEECEGAPVREVDLASSPRYLEDDFEGNGGMRVVSLTSPREVSDGEGREVVIY